MGGVAGLLVVALLLIFLVDAVNGTSAAPSEAGAGSAIGQARPEDYRAWPSLKQFEPIADRTADAKPLTAEEIFNVRTVKAGKQSLKLTQRQLDADCAAVLWGEELIDQVADAGCTQAVRGLFTSSDGVYIAQFTLLNLADAEAANTLVTRLESLHRGGWVLPLQPDQAPFSGYTEASGHAMGHYAGLVWVGRKDGAEPETGDDFVSLNLAARESEKAVYRRVVAVTGPTPPPTS